MNFIHNITVYLLDHDIQTMFELEMENYTSCRSINTESKDIIFPSLQITWHGSINQFDM